MTEPVRFDDGAAYERYMGVWSRLAGEQFLAWLAPRDGLRWLDVGADKQVPYLRRKMSRDYYRLILSRLGCSKVDIYRDTTKDQIHVLHF